jgi:hypothetical protein
MMRLIDCCRHARARFWIDELPDARSNCAETLKHVYATETMERIGREQVAVEIYWPTGGRALYGLLGVRFAPAESGQLCVEICQDPAAGRTFMDSIAVLQDDVRVGLLPEYASAVAATISIEENTLARLPPGRLVFDCGAHGLAGSAWVVFQALTSVLLELLLAHEAPSDDLVCELLRSQLFPSTAGT